MARKIETYELTNLLKQLKDLQKKDMTASGIKLEISHLDNSAIGECQFLGEYLPELIPILLKSIEESLTIRLQNAQSDIAKIKHALEY